MAAKKNAYRKLGEKLIAGKISLEEFQNAAFDEASRQVRQTAGHESFADVGPALVDLDRHRRCGFPEVIYGEGKSVSAMVKIIERLLEAGEKTLATRVSPEKGAELLKIFPKGVYHPVARTFRIEAKVSGKKSRSPNGKVAVISAGTSDLSVASEALETARWTGAETVFIQDAGVAGPDRLRSRLSDLTHVDAIVVVAGMEGALPSVVGGYVRVPVIAVPTSVGYGASFGGVAALLGMLNSCASNVVVVNIDAGFKAGYVAGLIAGSKKHRSNKKAPVRGPKNPAD